jgi:glycosyltransferase involved in cell wall biosynthesis
MDKITFCIPSKSNLYYLKTCIPSIRENAFRDDHEIIIFIDSDEDGTIEWLEQVKDQYNLTYYVNPNLGKGLFGIGKAYDFCVEKSTTNIFMIFHADMILGKNADLNAIKHLKEKTVVCSTRIEPPIHPNAGEKIQIDFGMWSEEFNKKEFNQYVNKHLKDKKTTEGIFAPWMMYKNEFLQILGGHDPTLHSCREDSDLFNRMLLADFNFIQSWNSLVYHFTGRGAGSFDGDPERHKQWREDMYKSTLAFIKKWGTNIQHTPLMKPIVSPVYKKSIKINNPNPQLEQALEPWFNEGEDIIVTIDGNTFNQQDFQYIQQLNNIVKESGEIGEFQLGNLYIKINSLKEYQNDLIHI